MSGGGVHAPLGALALRARRAGRELIAAVAARRMLIVAVALLGWLTWPVSGLVAAPTLDNSWVVGLSLAVSRSLAFGRRIVFTYGPLGFITQPRALSGGILVAGFIGAAALDLLLASLLLRALRDRLPLIPAVLVALAGLLIIAAPDVSYLDDIGFAACALALGRRASAPRWRRGGWRWGAKRLPPSPSS